MFRPDANAARFTASAQRMAMPPLPEQVFLDSLRQIIEIDREWIPQDDEGSLYLRPFVYASEVFLGVRPAMEYLYLVIASPVGAVLHRRGQAGHASGSRRTTPGRRPAAPARPSAAATTPPASSAQAEAIEHGCDQVVYLDAVERKYVDELGGMNVFFVIDDGTLVTPPLTGTILPGITRDVGPHAGRGGPAAASTNARSASTSGGRARRRGRIREVFACGTAAVITPIGRVRVPGRRVHHRRRRPRRGHHGPAPGVGRHPARPGRRPVRLGPQGPADRGCAVALLSRAGGRASRRAARPDRPMSRA